MISQVNVYEITTLLFNTVFRKKDENCGRIETDMSLRQKKNDAFLYLNPVGESQVVAVPSA